MDLKIINYPYPGVYGLVSSTNVIYVGSSTNVQRRLKQHQSIFQQIQSADDDHIYGYNSKSEADIKSGIDFHSILLEPCSESITVSELRDKETYWIHRCMKFCDVYNKTIPYADIPYDSFSNFPINGIPALVNLKSGKIFVLFGKIDTASVLKSKIRPIIHQLNHGTFKNTELQEDFNHGDPIKYMCFSGYMLDEFLTATKSFRYNLSQKEQNRLTTIKRKKKLG